MDEIAKKTIDIAIVEFNETAECVRPFTPLLKMEPVELVARGRTAMGAGINKAIDMVKEQNRFYEAEGIEVHRPWIFMITDGAPTDDIALAAQRIKEEETKGKYGKLKFWALGVGDFNKEALFSLFEGCPAKRVLALNDFNFGSIFNWMSESMATISVSRVGEDVQLGNLPTNAQVIPPNY